MLTVLPTSASDSRPAAAALSVASAASSSFPVGEKFYGLENSNNICYCNSVLQALYACRPFRQQLLVYHEESRARRSKEADTLLSCLSTLFYRIQTSRKPRGVVSASAFVRKLKKANEQFDSIAHQDAQEFLIFLLNNLSDTLTTERRDRLHAASTAAAAAAAPPATPPPVKRSALSALFSSHSSAQAPAAAAPDASASPALPDMSQLSAATAMGSAAEKGGESNQPSLSSSQPADQPSAPASSSSSSASQQSASAASSSSSAAAPATSAPSSSSPPAGGSSSPAASSSASSWVQQLFEGRLTNVTECIRCGCVSQRDESFLDLSVDLMEHRSLTACLRAFSHEEMLNGVDKFLCDSCGCRQEAVKSLKLKRLPPVLLLHMKRFKYSEQTRGFSKLCFRIAFPLTLRLDSSSGGDDADDADGKRGAAGAAASAGSGGVRQPLYELTAVVVHIGNGARSGHYVCMCRGSNGQFYLYDDASISAISEDDVRATFGTEMGGSHQDGYLLFYSRESELTTEDSPLPLQSIPAPASTQTLVDTATAADTERAAASDTESAVVSLAATAAPITVS